MFDFDDMPILKWVWLFCCVCIVADVAMSIYVAKANDNDDGGHRSSGFVAIWTMLLVVFYGVSGTGVLLQKKSTNFNLGNLLGFGVALSQLFFVLGVYFLLVAKDDHKHHNHEHSIEQEAANDGMGSFCFINAAMLFGWTIVLHFKRNELYIANVSGFDEALPSGDANYDDAMIEHGQI